MTTGRWMLAIVALAFTLPAAVQAGGADPMRCESIAMRKEADRYRCLGRCQHQGDRLAARQDPNADVITQGCENDCEDRFAIAMDQMDGRKACGGGSDRAGDPAADPNKCMARLMRAKASALGCSAACGSRGAHRTGFDVDGCVQGCDTRYDQDVQRILSKPFCAGQTAP